MTQQAVHDQMHSGLVETPVLLGGIHAVALMAIHADLAIKILEIMFLFLAVVDIVTVQTAQRLRTAHGSMGTGTNGFCRLLVTFLAVFALQTLLMTSDILMAVQTACAPVDPF